MSIPFHSVAHGYTFGTSLFLNIGDSDFGFVSDFEFFVHFLPGSVESIRVHRQGRLI